MLAHRKSTPIAALQPLDAGSTSSYILNAKTPGWTLLKQTPAIPHQKPIGILVFDIDGTLYDGKKRTVLNKERIQKIIEKALKNNILIVAATARHFLRAEQKSDLPQKENPVIQIIQEIHPNAFSWVYFTDNKSKKNVLEDLKIKHGAHLLDAKTKICLVDDQDDFIAECRQAGFGTIQVDAQNEYLDAIDEYIDILSYATAFEKELLKIKGFDLEKLSALVLQHSKVTGRLPLYVNQVLLTLSTEDEKRKFILKINELCPSLFSEAFKLELTYVLRILLSSKNLNEIWEDLNHWMVAKQISPDIFAWFFKEIKAKNINFSKEAQQLLSRALATNEVDNAIIIIKHLNNQYTEENLKLLATQTNPYLKGVHVKYLIIEYMKYQQKLLITNCYKPGLFTGPTRLDKAKAAAAILTCLENNTRVTDKATLTIIAGSKKLTAIHAKVAKLLALQKPKDAPVLENSGLGFSK